LINLLYFPTLSAAAKRFAAAISCVTHAPLLHLPAYSASAKVIWFIIEKLWRATDDGFEYEKGRYIDFSL
jgi:hypothetical protein